MSTETPIFECDYSSGCKLFGINIGNASDLASLTTQYMPLFLWSVFIGWVGTNLFFYNGLWFVDYVGWYENPVDQFTAIFLDFLYNLTTIDVIGYPVRFGIQLIQAIVQPDSEDPIQGAMFYILFIVLMYPIISSVFVYWAGLFLVFIPFYTVMFLVRPDMFLLEEPAESDLADWSILYKPRPGVPAIIAELYAVSRLLVFDINYLTRQVEFGLNFGAFIFLFFVTLVLFVVFFLVGSNAFWLAVSVSWALIPVLAFIEMLFGNFSFEDVPLEYWRMDDCGPIYDHKPSEQETPGEKANEQDPATTPQEPKDPKPVEPEQPAEPEKPEEPSPEEQPPTEPEEPEEPEEPVLPEEPAQPEENPTTDKDTPPSTEPDVNPDPSTDPTEDPDYQPPSEPETDPLTDPETQPEAEPEVPASDDTNEDPSTDATTPPEDNSPEDPSSTVIDETTPAAEEEATPASPEEGEEPADPSEPEGPFQD